MVYRITVDGVKKYAETPIMSYSRDNDMDARKRIASYFREKENAAEIIFDNSFADVEKLHLQAEEFYQKVMELNSIWMSLPYDRGWGPDEMGLLIPELMQIYMLAMKLPDLEYMEDMDYEWNPDLFNRKIEFLPEYEHYWEVFDPYCCAPNEERDEVIRENVCVGALLDDLGDILGNLSGGVDAYRAGLVCDAIFNWRFDMLIHYGHHIRDAIRAMGSVWEESMHQKEREWDDYWAYDQDSVIIATDGEKIERKIHQNADDSSHPGRD